MRKKRRMRGRTSDSAGHAIGLEVLELLRLHTNRYHILRKEERHLRRDKKDMSIKRKVGEGEEDGRMRYHGLVDELSGRNDNNGARSLSASPITTARYIITIREKEKEKEVEEKMDEKRRTLGFLLLIDELVEERKEVGESLSSSSLSGDENALPIEDLRDRDRLKEDEGCEGGERRSEREDEEEGMNLDFGGLSDSPLVKEDFQEAFRFDTQFQEILGEFNRGLGLFLNREVVDGDRLIEQKR